MQRFRFVSGFLVGAAVAVLSVVSIGSVRAFNPQPEPPGDFVHRLEAVANVLAGANRQLVRIAAVMNSPPEPDKAKIRAALGEISAECSNTEVLVDELALRVRPR